MIQYDRLKKYDSKGRRIERAAGSELRISRSELLAYIETSEQRIARRLSNIPKQDLPLAFIDVTERERTKHVNRLHPYLGKFIPQLAEYFLKSYFSPGEVVIDPFAGSGTTLVQAAEMGIHGIGVELSEFNVLISRVKLARYDQKLLEKEILDIMQKTINYSENIKPGRDFFCESEYLRTWFASKSLQEMLYYKSLISDYEYKDLLKVLLSRTIRSCRLIYHYELATPSRPVTEPYVCYKHRNKICTPVSSIIPRLKFYSRDTIRRIEEFSRVRRDCASVVLEGDSRHIRIEEECGRMLSENWYGKQKFRGVITSPPYVGQIDYHEQHRYAYELFGLKRQDSLEIGRKENGKGAKARENYIQGISVALGNVKTFLPRGAVWCIVANDSLNLYPEIFARSGLEIKKTHLRPVEDRTERDKKPYSESIFIVS